MSPAIKLLRTNSDHADFIALVQLLDAYLAKLDGEEHGFYDQFNKIAHLRHVVVAYENGKPVGCGALKQHGDDAMEVKRMYVSPAMRQKGIATAVLSELERWTRELSFSRCVLETGKRQPEAVALYKRSGYRLIPNYGQYAGVENSLCFEKEL